MRAYLAVFAALAIAACDSGSVPSPADRQAGGGDAAAEIDVTNVALNPEGLTAGAERFYFAAGKEEVVGAVSQTLGDPTMVGEDMECGGGPMEVYAWGKGLKVHFQDGSFVGWIAREGVLAAGTVTIAGDVEIGTPRSAVEGKPGYVALEDSTLGAEFALGDAIGGFFESGAVSSIYAGTQCFYR